MSLCEKCGTSWTTTGMTLCPICGCKVGDAAAIAEPSRDRLTTHFSGLKESAATENGAAKSNGSAVLTAPPDLTSSMVPAAPHPASANPEPNESRPLPPLKVTVFPKAERHSAASGLPSTGGEAPLSESTVTVPLWLEKTSTGLQAAPAGNGDNALPAPVRPLNGPLILGALGLLSAAMIPVTLAFESNRILGILGFCMSAFFVPFAPIAWIAGLSAEKRRREQGVRPELRVVMGRLLGQCATLLLIAEVTAVLVLIAVLRLSGKLPSTFWLPQY
jgi:hypothetical protein